MNVAISGPPDAIRGSKVDVQALEKRGREMLRALRLGKAELSIALVDDSEIRGLNHDYSDKRRATDVLSFSLVEGDHSDHRQGLLGDVVISVETAAKHASDRHRSLDEVVTRLLIHGVLHLIGHDHEDDVDASLMASEERRLWRVMQG